MAFYNAGNEAPSNDICDLSNDNQIIDDLSIIPLNKDSFGKFHLVKIMNDVYLNWYVFEYMSDITLSLVKIFSRTNKRYLHYL